MTQAEENSFKQLELLRKCIPFPPCETSDRLGWKGMQAVRYSRIPTSGDLSLPPIALHSIFLHLRSPERFNLRIEELKRNTPFPTRSIHVVPAGSPLLVCWEGSRDVVVVYLEPSVVAQMATESFALGSTRTVVPPLYSLNAPELRSVILSVYSELRIGSGVQLLVESLANILSVI